jgi:rhodanese-related sulfurtransferase
MKVLLSLGISLLLLGCQAQEQEQANTAPTSENKAQETQVNPYANLDVSQAKQLIDKGDVVVLDVRTDREFNAGHIEGARQLDFFGDDFADELAKLPKDKSYVVYCASGNRSGQAVNMMKEMHFEEAHNMLGGIGAWSSKSYKTVR